MNFTMNIHRVKNIRLSAVRPNQTIAERYATRSLVIETENGSFELTLFSVFVDENDEQPLLEIKV